MHVLKLKRCSVKLQRLEHTLAMTTPYIILSSGTILLNQSTTNIRNNNPEWHSVSKNARTECKICNSQFSSWQTTVRHYVNKHPNDEVFLSRVSPSIAELLRDPTTIHQSRKNSGCHSCKYTQICYFCDKSLCFDKNDWVNHIARHTGYFRYECTRCSIKFMRHNEHTNTDACNIVKSTQRQFDEAFSKVSVTAFLCDLCNYVRFERCGIEKHLRKEHDEHNDDESKFQEVTFLRQPTPGKFILLYQFQFILNPNRPECYQIKPE